MIKNFGLTSRRKEVATSFLTVKSNPYRKFLLKQMRKIEKHQNAEEEQLEKELEEEIMKIATNFCRKVQTWDEADSLVTDAILSSAQDADEKINAESLNLESSHKDSNSYIVHLNDPAWVAELFRVDFNPLWMQGFMRELETQEHPQCDLLGKYSAKLVKNVETNKIH